MMSSSFNIATTTLNDIPVDKKISFLDLRVTDEGLRQEILDAVEQVLKHGRFINGPEVRAFEERIASYCDRKFAIGVNSGTDALFLALKCVGIGAGDEVITTSLSWIATANAIAMTGATPVFADIRDDLNIDPESIKRLITSKTRAIVPVHYTGKVAQMNEIMKIAEENKLDVIEDAAQSFGSKYCNRPSGSFGTMATFSMNPMKVLAACGEAGAIVFDNEEFYEKLEVLRYNGTINKEVCIETSLNGRIDTVQAAILLKQLERVDEIIAKRREIAALYKELLSGVVTIPEEQADEWDSYYSYTICVENRESLIEFLKEKKIETKIQHPILMPKQPAYSEGVLGEYRNAERIVEQILCLPAHEKMKKEDVEFVSQCIREWKE